MSDFPRSALYLYICAGAALLLLAIMLIGKVLGMKIYKYLFAVPILLLVCFLVFALLVQFKIIGEPDKGTHTDTGTPTETQTETHTETHTATHTETHTDTDTGTPCSDDNPCSDGQICEFGFCVGYSGLWNSLYINEEGTNAISFTQLNNTVSCTIFIDGKQEGINTGGAIRNFTISGLGIPFATISPDYTTLTWTATNPADPIYNGIWSKRKTPSAGQGGTCNDYISCTSGLVCKDKKCSTCDNQTNPCLNGLACSKNVCSPCDDASNPCPNDLLCNKSNRCSPCDDQSNPCPIGLLCNQIKCMPSCYEWKLWNASDYPQAPAWLIGGDNDSDGTYTAPVAFQNNNNWYFGTAYIDNRVATRNYLIYGQDAANNTIFTHDGSALYGLQAGPGCPPTIETTTDPTKAVQFHGVSVCMGDGDFTPFLYFDPADQYCGSDGKLIADYPASQS